MVIKTRFAPSPTGDLHVGGARTALFSWLYAKKQGGQFVLRIEDTDLERSSQESIQAIFDAMNWLGLKYDEGPFYQMQRMPRYTECIEQLIAEGKAYRCYCTKEELIDMREAQLARKEKPRYDGRCQHRSTIPPQDLPYVVRFKNPTSGSVKWHDIVKGEIEIANKELDDLVIARTNGTPTYNFTVVIDDWDMGITHVIRGDDHVNNTPRQINMLNALNAKIPYYGHVPMILADDGKRLSKRHNAVGVMQYKNDGYLPEALLNYLIRLGWSCGDEEIFSLESMIEKFDIKHISKSPAMFNTDKLNWLNQHYMKTLPTEEVADMLQDQYDQLKIDTNHGPNLQEIIPIMAERVNTLKNMAVATRYCFEDFSEFNLKAAQKHLRPAAQAPLQAVKAQLSRIDCWQPQILHQTVVMTAEELGISIGKVGMPLRVAITGTGVSPELGVTLAWVGKERVLKRIDMTLTFIAMRVS